jgi:hypothetical protein
MSRSPRPSRPVEVGAADPAPATAAARPPDAATVRRHDDARGPTFGGAAARGVASLEFARVARALAEAARAEGWRVPGFRSPPKLAGAERTVRRRRDGGSVVAVRIQGRPWPAVLGDLVEGVVVVNGLRGAEADRCRNLLWAVALPEAACAA